MSTTDRDAMKLALRTAVKLKTIEAELGKQILPFVNDRDKLNQIALQGKMRTNYLIELALVAGGTRRRRRPNLMVG